MGGRTGTNPNRITVLLLALLLFAVTPLTVFAEVTDPLQALATKAGCAYEDILTSDLVVPGEAVSDWIAIATGCSGNPVKRNAYLKGLEDYVEKEYSQNGGLHSIKATEYHRISLAVLALGGDPTNFGVDGSGNPIDLIADGTYNWSYSDSLGMQGLNGWIFALITLDAKDYQVPADAVYSRENMIEEILDAQTDEGGFGLSGGSPDVDITAMTLQALAPYYPGDPEVQGSVDRALGWLSAQQNDKGDFTSWGSGTAEGTAQTVIALCSLGIDPRTDERFLKNGSSAMDGLLQYQTQSGMFKHTLDGDEDAMATEQAALALIAVQRLDQKGDRIYDFTEVAVYKGEEDTAVKKEPISAVVWVAVAAGVVLIAVGTVAVFIKRGKKKHV